MLFCAISEAKRILLERELPYTLKSANKQLTHVASLQRRFYTLGPIFVLHVNIYSSSLRLFKIDLLVSLLSATHGQCLILMLCLPLSWLNVTFVIRGAPDLQFSNPAGTGFTGFGQKFRPDLSDLKQNILG